MATDYLSTTDYYKERAPVYDRVYDYPERQKDLQFLEKYLGEKLAGRDVLEVAAGTGYWTRFLARTANSVLATDATKQALDQIKNRALAKPVDSKVHDAYALCELPGRFDGFFAGLWLSHVPRQKLTEFMQSVHGCLKPGAMVIYLDNSVAQCLRLPISHTDENGNTFQDRSLDNGKVYRVLKNFPSEKMLVTAISEIGTEHKFMSLDHFWLFEYRAI